MKNRIKIDFEVEAISENEKETIFLKIDNLFYKFVWLNEIISSNRIEQCYLLRYELAIYLKSHIDSNTFDNTFILTSGEEVNFKGNKEQLEIYLKFLFSDTVFHINNNNELITTLHADLNILESTREKLNSIGKDKLLPKLLGKLVDDPFFDEEMGKKLTNKDVEIIQFESALSKKRSGIGLFKIYALLLNKNLANTRGLKNSLLSNFDFVFNNVNCNCENEGCFFDILKDNQLYFFKNSYHGKNGEVDSTKVEFDFDEIWNTLSIRKKASLIFLYDEFGNSTLLNLAFVKPNFNLRNYQFLMCYQYQPDSKEEKMVRQVSTLSNFFIKIDK